MLGLTHRKPEHRTVRRLMKRGMSPSEIRERNRDLARAVDDLVPQRPAQGHGSVVEAPSPSALGRR